MYFGFVLNFICLVIVWIYFGCCPALRGCGFRVFSSASSFISASRENSCMSTLTPRDCADVSGDHRSHKSSIASHCLPSSSTVASLFFFILVLSGDGWLQSGIRIVWLICFILDHGFY
uniref:Uncharacterized protein n=1 Tax=Manihot esculenta TaxID=3983 RepID=A0A2C9W5K7_MANES